MVILRPTRKLTSALPVAEVLQERSDTALGDWYVNRIVVDRQPLLLLVSSASLLPILVPAREVRALPKRLGDLVAARLRRSKIDAQLIDAEKRAMEKVEIGPTVNRSVLGIMVEFARMIPYHLEPGEWSESELREVEDRLAETPCHAAHGPDRVIFPGRRASELLLAKWLATGS